MNNNNKMIQTNFLMSYPAISVYKFEYLKEEQDVLEYWRNSSIYLICQRPVLYFDDICLDDGIITMKIKQKDNDNELIIELAIGEGHRYYRNQDTFILNIHFYQDEKQTEQPFKNAAGIKLFDEQNNFIVWLSPEKLLYEYIKNGLEINVMGDINEFITYNVHYIGQAQNQNIWERLTGHEKLSKVLTLEHPFIKGEFSPYELTLIFLKLDNVTEIGLVRTDEEFFESLNSDKELSDKVDSIFQPQTFDDVRSFVINDFEAYLINLLEPKYNQILFKNYPSIKNGLKSLGYFEINHIPIIFANLKTEEATVSVTLTPVYAKKEK
jgi:hypothetical protein